MSWTDRYWYSAEGLRLHYRDYEGPRDKPPILCIPGLTRNARDFEPIFCETLTMDEQVRAFAEASVVIGPNGSAMLNTIFAPPDATVIMFSRRELFNMGAISVQEHAGLAPFRLLPGDPVGESTAGFHSDYRVAVAEVAAMLAAYGIS